jgi:hypothetical protein
MAFQIQSSHFGSSRSGRFGNQFFQLFFFHIVGEILKCPIRMPAWKDQFIFENHQYADPIVVSNIYDLELVYSRSEGPEATVNLIKPLFNETQKTLDITGSFQFHTETLYNYRKLLDNKFHYTNTANNIVSKLEELKKNRELISVHWREGDYNDFNNQHPYFWKPSMENLLLEIKKLQRITGGRGQVYVASDDTKNIVDFLTSQGVAVICANELAQNESELFLWDFLALVKSDVLVAANSTMSIAAALLNKNAQLFLRAGSPLGKFNTFAPWHTEVLINQFQNNLT